MSDLIPSLRPGLDVFASPDPERPGVVLRDPMGYSDAIAIVPPPWLPVLRCCNGHTTLLDCQAQLTRLSGEIGVEVGRMQRGPVVDGQEVGFAVERVVGYAVRAVDSWSDEMRELMDDDLRDDVVALGQ